MLTRRERIYDLKNRLGIHRGNPTKHVVELNAEDTEMCIAALVDAERLIGSDLSETKVREGMNRGELQLCGFQLTPNCPQTRLVEKSADDVERERLTELTRILSASLYWEKV